MSFKSFFDSFEPNVRLKKDIDFYDLVELRLTLPGGGNKGGYAPADIKEKIASVTDPAAA